MAKLPIRGFGRRGYFLGWGANRIRSLNFTVATLNRDEPITVRMLFPDDDVCTDGNGNLVWNRDPNSGDWRGRASSDVTLAIPLVVVPAGHNLFRLDDPWVGRYGVESVAYGDVVEVERLDDDVLVFQRVVEKGNWTIDEWILGPEFIRSDAMRPLFEKTEASGGFLAEDPWFGGMLWIFLPPDATYHPIEDIKAAAKNWDGWDK
jgi:hypothetical protein